jgi:hypothetical protein
VGVAGGTKSFDCSAFVAGSQCFNMSDELIIRVVSVAVETY